MLAEGEGVLRFVLRRSIVSAVLVVALLSIVFFLVHLVPGDPLLPEDADPASIAAQRRQLGLDRPLLVQYGRWIGGFLRGDLGTSFATRQPVSDTLLHALPNTVLLAALALGLRFALGIAAGTVAALRHGRAADRGLVIGALILYSVPGFWLAVMLQLVFAYGLRWLPADSMHALDVETQGFLARALDLARHLVLPVLVLGLPGVASTARYMRASLLEVLSQDYVRAAEARGLGRRSVVLRHAFRNALGPIVTLAGLSLPALVGGALLVETIFTWPGMGRVAYLAVGTRDLPVLLGATCLSAALVVAGNLLADIGSALLDPRARVGREA
jgi:peptide/nickel transport system permease protein